MGGKTGRPKSTSYWRKTQGMTAVLLLLWFCVTLLTCLYAPELNAFIIMGFPLGFYFAAQGSLLVFLVIVGGYAWYMARLDRRENRKSFSDNP